MQTQRTIGKRVLVIGVFIVALALGGFGVPSAYASVWQLDDGFESNPTATWSLYHSAIGSGGFDINAGTARSGSNSAWLTAQTGWSSVGRSVSLTSFLAGRTLTCAARIYIQPLSTAKLNFEVIDPPTWTYVSLKTVTLNSGPYTAVTTNSFVPARKDVFVRVSLGSDTGFSVVRVDDLIVQCQYL